MTINNNFDVFRTGDGTVSKYIHEDGSETAIKLVKSIQNIVNPLTKEIEVRKTDRNKSRDSESVLLIDKMLLFY